MVCSLSRGADTHTKHTLTMSWQAYVDNLVQSQKVDKAILASRAGDSIWAQSPGFSPTADELKALAQGFDDPSNLQANGLRLQSQKYFVVKAEDRSIYGKLDQDGVVAIRTAQTILIAHYAYPVSAGEAVKVAEAMADYLISVNY